jgi:chitin disaccharide deacetylase
MNKMLPTTGFTLIADDYAMTPGVSRGILRLLEAGRLSGTGAMTNRPHWKGWSGALATHADNAWIGLHLNLTLGAPLTPMPLLAPGGQLPTIGTLAKGALLDRLPLEEIAEEIRAQIDAFEQAMGRGPDFIDGHQHAHGLPGIRDLLLAEAATRYAAREGRPWLRDSADRAFRIIRRGAHTRKAFAVSFVSAGFGKAARAAGFQTNDGFAGFSAFDPLADLTADMASYLTSPGARHLVMIHPGEVDDELRGLDPAVESRAAEQAFLLSDAFQAIQHVAGQRLVLKP